MRYLGEPLHISFNFELVNDSNAYDIILLTKSSEYCQDQINIKVYKENFRFIGSVIAKNCNSSLHLREFPNEAQIAKVRCFI